MAITTRSLEGWALIASALAVVPPAWAQPGASGGGTTVEAKAAADRGKHAYDREDYATAARELGHAYAITRVPTMGLWYARSLAEAGKLREAAETYEQLLAFDPSGMSEQNRAAQQTAQDEAKTDLAALLPRIPVFVVDLDEGLAGATPVTVSVDGVEIAPDSWSSCRVNPGEHGVEARLGTTGLAVEARSGERANNGRSFSVKEGERWSVAVTEVEARDRAQEPLDEHPPAPRPPPPAETKPSHPLRPQRLAAYGAFAASAAGVLVYGIAGGYGVAKQQQMEDENDCWASGVGRACDFEDSESLVAYKTVRAVNITGLVVGLVGAGAGVTLLLVEPKTERGGLSARLGLGSVAVRGRF